MPDIILSNVHKAYPHGQSHLKGSPLQVLKGISLAFEAGQVYGIIGKSGAGKSTLLRCLNGLETPDQGEINIGGYPLTQSTGAARQKILQKIGTVFQGFNLLSRRTVLQNIALPLEFKGEPADKITVKAREMAALVGLGDKAYAYPAQLSGGQRQRIAIARALVCDVSLLICDEFTSALDPETALEILALLQALNHSLKVTMVMVTHNMSVIREICDQVYVMDDGQIVESGPIETVLLRPRHPVTHSLVRNLFMKDLPQGMQENLKPTRALKDHALVRLIFSGKCAHQPLIASVIENFHVPVNIIAGNLDHVREISFGSLIVSLPSTTASPENPLLDQILKYFSDNSVSAEILGYISPS